MQGTSQSSFVSIERNRTGRVEKVIIVTSSCISITVNIIWSNIHPNNVKVFESRGLIDRILKMAMRKEIETQREVIALIRNLACHARLRPLLLDRGVMNAVSISKVPYFQLDAEFIL